MLPRQSSVLWGTGSGDAVKIWSLHLASYWLHIQAIIENTLINYLFKRIIFFSIFHAGQLRLKGMFQVLSGSILQLLHLRARGVSWWKTKSLGNADLQNVLFAAFPGREYTRRASCEPDIKMWLTGWQCWASERTGGISPPSAAPHFWPQRVFINLRPWDLGEVAKRKLAFPTP